MATNLHKFFASFKITLKLLVNMHNFIHLLARKVFASGKEKFSLAVSFGLSAVGLQIYLKYK